MKNVIPFSKEIIFKTNIAEISSISLEHNYTITDCVLNGEFIITGDYKSHELSVNKENFKYSLPFSIDLDENIDVETIKMEIEDFTYDFHDDVLIVKIEYSIIGERIKKENREIIIPDAVEIENPDDLISFDDVSNVVLENEVEAYGDEESRKKMDIIEETENEIVSNEEEEVISTKEDEVLVSEKEVQEKSEYVTYHVHILKENETVESVCKLYDVSMSVIEEYNDVKNIGVSDKIIIPIYQDE